ncbi:hypothetical protein RAD16_05195 [Bradyrhizobium sp. 18BD]
MADQGRDALEMIIGSMMAQSAIIEFLVKQGVIERDPLLEHLASRRVSWESTATPNALFAIDLLSSILAGRQPPRPPGPLN